LSDLSNDRLVVLDEVDEALRVRVMVELGEERG